MIVEGVCKKCLNRDQDTDFCTLPCPHKPAEPEVEKPAKAKKK